MTNFLQLAILTRDPILSLGLALARIPCAHVENRNHTTFFKNTNLRCKDAFKSVTPGISYWIPRLGRWGFDFETTSNGDLLIRCGDAKIRADGDDVCLIVEEVFGTLQYGLVEEKPSIVIDIGMNVGVSALFFASQTWCERVIGFEPLASTFSRAERNLSLNPVLATKITAHDYGLGDGNYEARAIVVPGNSGLTSIVQRVDGDATRSPDLVEIRNVVEVLEPVLSEADNLHIHLKVDCEGGEREIFSALPGNMLKRFKTIMLEWHDQDSRQMIIRKLCAMQFTVLINRVKLQGGLLYAVRVN